MVQDKPVAAQEPIAWQSIVSAINAVAREATSRGEMFPQEASEQIEDSEAAKRVCGMVEWYATCGGSVAMRLPDWPLYDHASPCARCAELEAYNATRTDELAASVKQCSELQAKITEQAKRIKALEAEFLSYKRVTGLAYQGSTLEARDKLSKADAVISTVLSELSVENGLDDATNKLILAAIEQYQKGGE